jgi:hypothetical protein
MFLSRFGFSFASFFFAGGLDIDFRSTSLSVVIHYIVLQTSWPQIVNTAISLSVTTHCDEGGYCIVLIM